MFTARFAVRVARAHNARRMSIDASNMNCVMYNWGDGTEGQLGHEKISTTSSIFGGKTYVQVEPRRLKNSSKFSQIAVGISFSLALTQDKKLLGFGKGFAGDESSRVPVMLAPEHSFSLIRAGSRHSAALTTTGKAFTWGENGSAFKGLGRLGHGEVDKVKSPKEVEYFSTNNIKLSDIACGGEHTHFLTASGELYSCGTGEFGRLGTGSNDNEPIPVHVELDEPLLQVSAGHNHSIGLSVNGHIYGWGKNDMSQLGLGDSYMDMYSMEARPRLVECALFKDKVFTQVCAGKGRSAAVTSDGELFMWGHKITMQPSKIETDFKVKKIVIAGDARTGACALLSTDNKLYTFGDYGSNMIGHEKNSMFSTKQPVPTLVPALASRLVVDVYGGFGQHMFAKVLNE